MKKNLNFLMCLAVAGLAFVSCEKDDDKDGGSSLAGGSTITASVADGASYNAEIDSVYAGLEWETGNKWGYDIIAKAPYKSGSFTITLPETVDAKYLYALNDEEEGIPAGITVSDETVKTASIFEFDAIKGGQQVGYISRSSIHEDALEDMDDEELIQIYANGIYSVQYMYANKPATIRGSFSSDDYFDDLDIDVPINYNLSLQKGWNVVVTKATVKINMATQSITASVDYSNSEPAGLKWYYSPYNYEYGYKKSAKSSVINLSIRKHKLF
jgi:hypothetical protein